MAGGFNTPEQHLIVAIDRRRIQSHHWLEKCGECRGKDDGGELIRVIVSNTHINGIYSKIEEHIWREWSKDSGSGQRHISSLCFLVPGYFTSRIYKAVPPSSADNLNKQCNEKQLLQNYKTSTSRKVMDKPKHWILQDL